MANNQYVNKVSYVENGTPRVLIDISNDTVTPSALAQGYTAHDASGAPIVGTATGGSMVIRDEADSHGGTIRHITAGSVVQGTLEVTENGTYDVAAYADVDVDVAAAAPTLQTKLVTPTESAQIVVPDTGYDGLDEVDVGAISSTYVGSGITRHGRNDITVSGDTVTVPDGYYAIPMSKSVAPGTAGTPTATKGSVSNHAISVTPSVTNATGYITGGTKSGTAVSVSASELVSGTLSITENGTTDVTNYASVDVNVSGSGGGFTLGTFTVEGSVSSSFIYTLGFIDCIVHNGQPTIIPRNVVSSNASDGIKSLGSTGHWFIAEDGFMYVAFIGNSIKAVPSVTATSGTATYVTEFDQNTYMYSGYSYKTSVQGYGRIYKLSPNAVVTLTYIDHS